MRVLFCCTTGGSGRRQFGGAERFLVEMLPALAERQVDVIACTPDDEVAASLREAGVPWISLGATRRIDLRYASAIRQLVGQVRPQLVSAHLLSAAMHARTALAVDKRAIPLVVTFHSSLWQYRDAAGSLRQKAAVQANITLDLVMRRVRPHMTVAVSASEAEELRARGRVKNIRVIPNPLPATWPAAASLAPAAAQPVRVGFLGRLEREKGADLLPAIAAALPDMEFLVAGSGSLSPAAAPNLAVLGRVDAASFLQKIDCLVVPSRVEAFGRSALEAMSLGIPVVHSGIGGLREITQRGDGRLAYQADLTSADMSRAIRRATDGTVPMEQRRELAQWYAREFSFGRCAHNWLELFREVARDVR
jgi:glycosyltransferase involved in cell wall biosynthesis